MRKFSTGDILGLSAVIVAVLVMLYGDNWLDWHHASEIEDRPALPKQAPRLEPIQAPPAVAPDQRKAILPHDVALRPVIIRQVVESPITTQPKPIVHPSLDDEISKIVRKSNRSAIAMNAEMECRSSMYRQDGSLVRLINEAVFSQNQFHNTNNSRVMIDDLARWAPKVSKYLADNKDSLPDISVFEIANASGSFGAFHRGGLKAWATMDAKRKALEAIRSELEKRPCDKIGKAAVAECEDNANCQLSKQ